MIVRFNGIILTVSSLENVAYNLLKRKWYKFEGKGAAWLVILTPFILLFGPFLMSCYIFNLNKRGEMCWHKCWKTDPKYDWFNCKVNVYYRLHRCWWRMLKTKCVGDNFEILVTVLAVFVTNILCCLTLASGTYIQKMSPISKCCHQQPKIVIYIKSPTCTCHQHLCSLCY